MQYRQDKVGVFVDVESTIARTGGYGMRYDVLRDFAARDVVGAPILLNAYVAAPDPDEAAPARLTNARNFQAALRDFGYRVVEAADPDTWPADELYAEVRRRSERLDTVLIATSDVGAQDVVQDLVQRGHRVELVAFNEVEPALSNRVDLFVSGHLIADLLPARGGKGQWGAEDSRVRGVCYSFSHDRGFGFIRYMAELGDLARIDTREEGSPYRSAFCHESELPAGISADDLPTREHIFEFTLAESDRGLQARDIVVV